MSGLDFVNSSYNQKTENSRSYVHLTNLSNQYTTATSLPVVSWDTTFWSSYEYLSLDINL